MFIHAHTSISPQGSSSPTRWTSINPSENGKLMAIEPTLEGVPSGMLRRMSKAVRMGIGGGLPLLKRYQTNGIIIGTANGGMEDCIKFLNQVIDYEEGLLTPGNFVQSTPNAIAGQLSLITKNKNYNATHVHLGLAFENALIDAMLFLKQYPQNAYLVGAVDEISTYNYNIDRLAGWYTQHLNSTDLFTTDHPATIAGEGAAMFLVNNEKSGAIAKLEALETIHSTEPKLIKERFHSFLKRNGSLKESNTLFISGENGDNRFDHFVTGCEAVMEKSSIARFKHLTGEYPTAVSFAVWLACDALHNPLLPDYFYKKNNRLPIIDRVVIYNLYQGKQHSFMLLSKT